MVYHLEDAELSFSFWAYRRVMSKQGFSHVGLATCDMESTKNFYENVLGFDCIVENRIEVKEGGYLQQAIFDIGQGQFIAFLESHEVPGIAEEYDTGITSSLGVPSMFYHIAFSVDTIEILDEMRCRLQKKGVNVSDIIQHGPAKSIYLKDPNQIQLEFTSATRELDQEATHGAFVVSKESFDPVG